MSDERKLKLTLQTIRHRKPTRLLASSSYCSKRNSIEIFFGDPWSKHLIMSDKRKLKLPLRTIWHQTPTRFCFKLIFFKEKIDRNIFRSPEASIVSWATRENWNWHCELSDTDNLLVYALNSYRSKRKSDRNISRFTEASIVSWAMRENWNWHWKLNDTRKLLVHADLDDDLDDDSVPFSWSGKSDITNKKGQKGQTCEDFIV